MDAKLFMCGEMTASASTYISANAAWREQLDAFEGKQLAD
jgi:hypothetical protein